MVRALDGLDDVLEQVPESLVVVRSELIVRLCDIEVDVADVEAYGLVGHRPDKTRQELERHPITTCLFCSFVLIDRLFGSENVSLL